MKFAKKPVEETTYMERVVCAFVNCCALSVSSTGINTAMTLPIFI